MRERCPPWIRFTLGLTLMLIPAMALAGGDVALLIGQKDLDLDLNPSDPFDALLGPLEDQSEFGVMFNFSGDGWPVSLAVDVLLADDDVTGSYSYYYPGYGTVTADVKFDVQTIEINVGVRKQFGEGKFRGYVGGGGDFITLDADASATLTAVGFPTITDSESDSDSGFGYWLNGGFIAQVGQKVNVGLDARLTGADLEIFPEPGFDDSFDAGGFHIGAFVGFRWGGG